MNTAFLLMAQYNGAAVIPLDAVCRDYFQHLSPALLARKVNEGDIALPIVLIDAGSNKTAKGVALIDLAQWLDDRIAAGRKECQQLTGKAYG